MGIVEEIGTVVENSLSDSITMWDGTSGPGWLLTINARTVLEGAYNGCSIAVNGVCLTVIRFTESQFTVGLAPETLLRTNLGDAAPGGLVNLERSMRADSRISGHNVQGHVDGTGTILEVLPDRDSLRVKIAAPPELLRMIVPKGYIAVDGISLTVVAVNAGSALSFTAEGAGWFSVMLIAYTQAHVTLPRKRVGERVNLEVDVVGKYLDRSAAAMLATVSELAAKLDESMSSVINRIDELEGRMQRIEQVVAQQGSAALSRDPAK